MTPAPDPPSTADGDEQEATPTPEPGGGAPPGSPPESGGPPRDESKDESSGVVAGLKGLVGDFPWIGTGLAGAAALVALILTAVGSTDSVGDLAREAPVRVFAGLILAVLLAPFLAELGKRQKRKRDKQRLWALASALMAVGIGVYAWAALDVSATPAAPDIAVKPHRTAGTAKVVVNATRLSADERVLVTAGWDDVSDEAKQETPPNDVFDGLIRPDDNGVAERTFQAGPVVRDRPLLVVARLIERDQTQKRIYCPDRHRLCDDERRFVRGVLIPQLDVSPDDMSLTFTIAKQAQAPGPVRVLVIQAGERTFAAARRVDKSPMVRPVPLTGARPGQRICVAATYLEGRFRCDSPGVASERFRLPR